MGCSSSRAVQCNDEGNKSTSNKKILLIEPSLYTPEISITYTQLLKERREFWETHGTATYGGIKEIWNALQKACESLLDGDIVTANSVIKTAGIILIDSNVTLCYDKSGSSYEVRSENVHFLHQDIKYCFRLQYFVTPGRSSWSMRSRRREKYKKRTKLKKELAQ